MDAEDLPRSDPSHDKLHVLRKREIVLRAKINVPRKNQEAQGTHLFGQLCLAAEKFNKDRHRQPTANGECVEDATAAMAAAQLTAWARSCAGRRPSCSLRRPPFSYRLTDIGQRHLPLRCTSASGRRPLANSQLAPACLSW